LVSPRTKKNFLLFGKRIAKLYVFLFYSNFS